MEKKKIRFLFLHFSSWNIRKTFPKQSPQETTVSQHHSLQKSRLRTWFQPVDEYTCFALWIFNINFYLWENEGKLLFAIDETTHYRHKGCNDDDVPYSNGWCEPSKRQKSDVCETGLVKKTRKGTQKEKIKKRYKWQSAKRSEAALNALTFKVV